MTFDVDRVWKGKVTRRMTLVVMPGLEVHTAAFFKPGEAYVVFAIRSRVTTPPEIKEVPAGSPVYEVSVCSPTALVSDIGTDIAQLGKARPPLPAR